MSLCAQTKLERLESKFYKSVKLELKKQNNVTCQEMMEQDRGSTWTSKILDYAITINNIVDSSNVYNVSGTVSYRVNIFHNHTELVTEMSYVYDFSGVAKYLLDDFLIVEIKM